MELEKGAVVRIGKPRKWYAMHFGQDEHRENIICGSWAGVNVQWTNDEAKVTCRACQRILGAADRGIER